METRASYVIVGSFVLFLTVALFAFILFIAKVQFDEVSQPYHIYFTGSVTGLDEGSPVRFRGVPVGVVSDIRIDPENVGRVQVTVSLSSSTPITQDAVATIEMQGITGVAYIQIFGGANGSPRLQALAGTVPVIPSKNSGISEVFERAPELLNRLVVLTSRAETLLSEGNAAEVAAILKNTNEVTANLATITGSLSTKVEGTVENISSAAAQFNAMSDKLVALADSLNVAAGEAKGMLRENREPIRDFMNTGLYDMSQLISEMRILMTNLSHMTAQIERDPPGFLLAGPKSGVEHGGEK